MKAAETDNNFFNDEHGFCSTFFIYFTEMAGTRIKNIENKCFPPTE
jgi:hypothetical protein